MRSPLLRPALALALFALSPLALAATSDPTLAQAEKLLDQKQPRSAYELLAPLEDERGGDPDYDYLLGLAALESGQAGAAAFAFERCLATDPKNGPCRVQMARTHLALGENKSARLELQAVNDSQPPAEVQSMVNQYLGALKQKEVSEKRRIGAYAQVGLGYDSNVSSTTPDGQIALPAFGGLPFALSGISTQQSDEFQQAEAGASIQYAVTPAWSVLADAAVDTRAYTDIDVFDTLNVDASIGASYRAGPSNLLVKLQAGNYQLDHDAYRSLYGMLTQYQYAYSDTAAVSGYVQASHLDYHLKGMPNADRYTVGGGYSQAFNVLYVPVIYAGLYGGQEKSDVENIGLGQDFYGLRLGGNLTVLSTLRLTTSLSVEQRKFDGVSPLFLTTRKDTGTDLSLGAIYQPAQHFTVRPTYTYSNNHSNIVLSDYDRHLVSLDIRYEL